MIVVELWRGNGRFTLLARGRRPGVGMVLDCVLLAKDWDEAEAATRDLLMFAPQGKDEAPMVGTVKFVQCQKEERNKRLVAEAMKNRKFHPLPKGMAVR